MVAHVSGTVFTVNMDQFMKDLSAGSDDFDEEIPSDDDANTQDVDERSHARLLDAISSLDGKKRLHHTLRTIHGQNMSEFGFKSQKVDTQSLMTEMMGSLHQSASHSELKKQLKAAYKSTQVVDTPLPKHITVKAHRAVAYEKSVTEVSKWDPVVTANRRAPQLKFPLEQSNQKLINTHMTFRPVTDLEKAVRAELAKVKPEHQISKGKVFTPVEEEEMKAMSLEEARERRAQLLSMRSLLYNKNSKLRWQNKIKSKRYRMIRKKEKLNKERKELEELALRDPQALMDTMQETEKRRVEERGRLRHRGHKKFARQAKIFAKYDDEKRQQIQDMLAKHKELTKKEHLPSSSESEDDADTPPVGPAPGSGPAHTKNAWMRPAVPTLPSSSVPQASATPQSNTAGDSSDDEEEDKEKKFLASFDLVGVDDDDDDRQEKERKFLAALESDSSDDDGDDDDSDNKDDPSYEETEPTLPQQLEDKHGSFGNEVKKDTLKTSTGKKKKRNHSQEQIQPSEPQTPSSPQDQQEDKPSNVEKTASLKSQTGNTKKKKQSAEHKAQSSTAEDAASQDAGKLTDDPAEQTKSKKKKRKKKKKAQTGDENDQTPSQKDAASSGTVQATASPETELPVDSPMELVRSKKKRKRSKKQKKDSAAAETGISAEELKLMAVVKGLKASDNDKPGAARKAQGSARRRAKQPGSTSQPDSTNQPDEPSDDKSRAAQAALITIAEAFDDDDVVEEFVAEKQRVAEDEAEKDVDLFVPGWGSWGGAGIVHSDKLRQRFLKKAKPRVRTDNNIGHVIISQKKNTAVEKHMLNKVPFPYKSLEHMKTALEKPIGRDFTSESQFKKNIKPRTVVNRVGQIIQPINEKALLHGGQKRKAADMSLDTKDTLSLDGKKQRGKQ